MLSTDSKYLVARSADDGVQMAMPCSLITDPRTFAFYNPRRLLLDADQLSSLGQFLPTEEAQRLLDLGTTLRDTAAFEVPTLLAVSPYGHICGSAFAPDLAHDDRMRLVAQSMKTFMDLADEVGARTRALWYLEPDATPEFRREALRLGFQEVSLGWTCRMPVRWPDFDSYVAALPSKRRQTVRNEVRRFVRSGGEISVHGPEALGDDVAALLVEHTLRHGIWTSIDRERMRFARVKQYLGDAVRLFAARQAGSLVGAGVAFEHADTLYCRQVGISEAAGPFTYFNLVYYAAVRFAAAKGLQRIDFGHQSYEPKLRRGCELIPRSGLIQTGEPPVQQFLALYDRATRRWGEMMTATLRDFL